MREEGGKGRRERKEGEEGEEGGRGRDKPKQWDEMGIYLVHIREATSKMRICTMEIAEHDQCPSV